MLLENLMVIFHVNDFKNKNCCVNKESSSTIISELSCKQRNVYSSGSVVKRPRKRGKVKSSPCVSYISSVGSERALIPVTSVSNRRKTKSRRRGQDVVDLNYISLKFVSSDSKIFIDNMRGVRPKPNVTAPKPQERRLLNPSLGKVLKEQNGKDVKRSNILLGNRSLKVSGYNAPIKIPSQVKDKLVSPESQQIIPSHGERIVKEIVPNSGSSNHSSLADRVDQFSFLKKQPIQRTRSTLLQNELPTTDSDTSITGESIMYIDRSVQCSDTDLDVQCKRSQKIICDVGQAGDKGMEYFNPVRTLNFLVRELRGKISEDAEDNNMARIIRDMENTISRLTNWSQNIIDNNWNTLISEEDLKCVLDLLRHPVHKKISEAANNNALEMQSKLEKLEDCCSKLEAISKQMEKVTTAKLKDEKQALLSELKEKNSGLESLNLRLNQQDVVVQELQTKTEEQNKIITSLKETYNKSSALNKILIEQLDDTEKKYQQLVTEMQFLLLEKEKNNILLKCKDQDISEMRKNLEEIKSLVIQHLSAISENDSSVNLVKWDTSKTASSLSVSAQQNKTVQNETPKYSPPVESTTPPTGDDEFWRKTNNGQVEKSVSQSQIPPPSKLQNKNVAYKESLKSIIGEMKQQMHLNKSLSLHNSLNPDDMMGITSWSDLDISDDEFQSGTRISDTDTNR